jgi:DNA-binding MarR family transcriptional regulator
MCSFLEVVMSNKNVQSVGANLVKCSLEDLVQLAKESIINKNSDRLKDIDRELTRFYCMGSVRNDYRGLEDFSKHIVGFVGWFHWGGICRWAEVETLVYRWQVMAELAHDLTRGVSPQKALVELKKSGYGTKLVEIIYKKKVMQPKEIMEALEINSLQQVSRLLARYEKEGIVSRETYGKNVFVSLAPQGIAVYKDYIQHQELNLITVISQLLKIFKKGEYDVIQKRLAEILKDSPNSSIIICFKGIVKLQQNKLSEGVKLIHKAIKLGLDIKEASELFSLLDLIDYLEVVKEKLYEMNMQKDKIVKNNSKAVRLLAMCNEYQGNRAKAIEIYGAEKQIA